MTNRTPPSPAAAEGLLEVPAAALALLHLPPLDGLRDGQVRGRHCLWCRSGPCPECETSSPGCEIGRALNRLVREGRRR
ncbi:hypothetical protein ACIOC2_20455 [Streptomyces sp. NPDC088337]|uniref:hypothetical protein n=1 Tax=unclassified Streptomyces TaxID=2593676 RepID=UPI00380733D5